MVHPPSMRRVRIAAFVLPCVVVLAGLAACTSTASPGWTFGWIGIYHPYLFRRIAKQVAATGPVLEAAPDSANVPVDNCRLATK